ncbi:MAG: transcriptional regulator/antitoxin, MazE [Acidobacteria bacterium]|nr:transcriptional regulator/antitoxin, MazE [Acidobacteriota bacterium]
MITTKIQKWGNSQGLRLAKHVLEESGMVVGDDVDVIASENEIVIRKKEKTFSLEELVSRMPKDYRTKEESFGPPVGREEW